MLLGDSKKKTCGNHHNFLQNLPQFLKFDEIALNVAKHLKKIHIKGLKTMQILKKLWNDIDIIL